MNRQRQRRPQRQDVIDALIDAAGRLFAERGYDGASVELISESAGYSTGALYSNFKSKEELFLRLYEIRTERRRDELRSAVADAGGGARGLAAAASGFSEALASESEWYLLYLEFALRAAREPTFAVRFKEQRQAALDELAAGIVEGLEQAGLSANLQASDLGRAVRALTHGFALERALGETDGADPLPGEVMRRIFRGSAT